MKFELGTVLYKCLKGSLPGWFLRPFHFFLSTREERLRHKADLELASLAVMPKKQRFVGLMQLGVLAMRQNDHRLQKAVLRAIGELGTDESVQVIEDWLANQSLAMTWSDLVEGISEGANEAEPIWKDRVFKALEKDLDNSSNTHVFAAWPFVSWPAAMIAIDPDRAVQVFVERKMLIPGAQGFVAALTAINGSSSAKVPAEVAASWLPGCLPNLKDRIAVEQYLLQLKAHAEFDLPETKRRLWEVVEGGGYFAQEAATLLLRIERLPDPVWALDSRVQRVGFDNVRPAEQNVWIVANWFTFPIHTSGFDRFSVSYEANHLMRTMDALSVIGAKQTSDCLREWALLFGSEWPQDQYKRGEMVDEQSLKPAETWESIVERFHCTENVDLLNLKYQLSCADQFERTNSKS